MWPRRGPAGSKAECQATVPEHTPGPRVGSALFGILVRIEWAWVARLLALPHSLAARVDGHPGTWIWQPHGEAR